MIRLTFAGKKLRKLVKISKQSMRANRTQAFQEFASANRYPMLVHCTQGKDRTGLLVALILLLLDMPLEAITYDYCLSESELLSEQESRLQEIREIGLTDDFAKTPRNWIPELHQYLEQKYGGIRSYLGSIGVDDRKQDRVVELLQP
jgi:protein-tyrosine phosphatase